MKKSQPMPLRTCKRAYPSMRLVVGRRPIQLPSRPCVSDDVWRAVGRIKHGLQKQLVLGNLDSKRDWGYAKEYVEMMWLMLQQETPDDYVVATGETHSVKEFVVEAFTMAGLNWEEHVQYDASFERPAEVELLIGDSAKAAKQLGWVPKVKFKELVRIMVESDLELAERDKHMAALA